MGYRRKDTRPRLALWMLVALGDIVLLLVSAGVPALVALLGVVAVTVAGVAAWRLTRRSALAGEGIVPVPVGARRRA
ncbi:MULTISPECIES: hypothetical protein [Micromonospora]|uniref:Uncharacterized protein n=1 Tax=Micromonospora sicca TaxID=2202420 RepID=A0A317DRR0_9ACTN|nr:MULTISPECIES: hypothetical protein [unclassified Micromonospora]MBM0227708.1 hypothetical protein [Micromonospora sp. ATA51]PWR17347.1 hypothetical protein DKT69_00650 [Micromonospora sp. 4G51]